MRRRDGRYPQFAAAREAVSEIGASLPGLVAEGAPAIDRGRERVERALTAGTVAPEGVSTLEPDGDWRTRTELLSYPVARVLISLLDEPAAVEKYAAAEAATVVEQLREDDDGGTDPRGGRGRVALQTALREFDLGAAVRVDPVDRDRLGPSRRWIQVDRYLALADPDWGREWRLAVRELSDGEVRVERAELFDLLEEAIRRYVAEDLPFEQVDEKLASALESQLDSVRALLSDSSAVPEVEAVIPELFPSCVARLVGRGTDRELGPRESFALLSFLAAIGMDREAVVGFTAETTLSVEQVSYQYPRIADGERERAQYPPPTCEALAAYGICENEDGHRDAGPTPAAAYAERVAAEGGDYVDWRERDH